MKLLLGHTMLPAHGLLELSTFERLGKCHPLGAHGLPMSPIPDLKGPSTQVEVSTQNRGNDCLYGNPNGGCYELGGVLFMGVLIVQALLSSWWLVTSVALLNSHSRSPTM